eukprot:COSAG03_NODE_2037_length_3197_cov_43.612976_2_plen_67_part_00
MALSELEAAANGKQAGAGTVSLSLSLSLRLPLSRLSPLARCVTAPYRDGGGGEDRCLGRFGEEEGL